MRWVRSKPGLYNFIGHVVLSAPNQFPKEDFLSSADQLDLGKAFEELRLGLEFVETARVDQAFRERLLSTLEDSLLAYRSGDKKRGAHLLQDFQRIIFGK